MTDLPRPVALASTAQPALTVSDASTSRTISAPGRGARGDRRLLAGLLGLTLLKILVAGCFRGTVEVRQMAKQAVPFLGGADVLTPAVTSGNPSFFPIGHYGLVASCWLVAQATGLAYSWVIKLPAIFADLLIALILWRLPRGGPRTAWWYMANPVTFLLSAYHGQPHTVAIAMAIAALWAADAGRPGLSGIALALAASIRQHLAVLLLPLALTTPRWRTLLGTCVALAALINWPLLRLDHPERVLAPGVGTYGTWGYAMLLRQGPRLLELAGLTGVAGIAEALNAAMLGLAPWIFRGCAAVFLVWCVRRARRGQLDRWHAALVFFLGVYAVAPGFGIQWLVWALPCWLLLDRRRALIYSVLAGAFLAGSYWQWSLNARYGLDSITASLGALRPMDLLGVVAVGGVGLLTWAWATLNLWRVVRVPSAR